MPPLPQLLTRFPRLALLKWDVQLAARRLTGGPRVLPDFLIIGVQRGGTTSLYNYLVQHPDVLPGLKKETHYFTLRYRPDLRSYREFFPTQAEINRDGKPFLTGEATPYYLFYPHTLARVRRHLPQARLIVLLRNPVDRAYSHYHHEVSTGAETLSFEDALAREERILPEETRKLQADQNYISFAHMHGSYKSRGLYADQLLPWIEQFDRQQILVLQSEAFYQDPASCMNTVFHFLNLPEWSQGTYKQYNLTKYDTMLPETRRGLEDFYRPHNQRLYQLLARDFGW